MAIFSPISARFYPRTSACSAAALRKERRIRIQNSAMMAPGMVVLTMTVRGVVEQEFEMLRTKSHDSAATNAASHRAHSPRRFTHIRRTPSPVIFA